MLGKQLAVALFGACFIAAEAWGQETTQQTGAPPAESAAADSNECVPSAPPPRLAIVMPKEPALPTCAAKNTCSRSVADKYNFDITIFNRAIRETNDVVGEYVDRLNEYARAATRYTNCEIDRLNAMRPGQ